MHTFADSVLTLGLLLAAVVEPNHDRAVKVLAWSALLVVALLLVVGFLCLVWLANGKLRSLSFLPLGAAAMAFWLIPNPCKEVRCSVIANIITSSAPSVLALFGSAALIVCGLAALRFVRSWRM